MTKQYPLPLPHHEAMEADDFMVTDSNHEAVAWIDNWPNWSAHCIVFYGPAASGKTHLMNVWMEKSNGVEGSKYLPSDVRALLSLSVAIDNAEQFAGDPAYEEALFHLYNYLRESKGWLLLTARAAPAQWNIQLPDLRSRLLSVPAISIAGPDDELLSALLIKQFGDRQIDIGKEVVDYLLPRIERSPAAIRNVVTELDRLSLAEGRGITIALARRITSMKD